MSPQNPPPGPSGYLPPNAVYGPPHAHGYGPPVRQPTGAVPWALGLLVLAFFPFVSSVVAGAVMLFTGRSQRTNGPLAAENGRRAANWGLTYLLLTVVLVGAHFGILAALKQIQGFFPFGLIITSWAVLSLVHIIVSIVGAVIANSGKVMKWNGIPFFRA